MDGRVLQVNLSPGGVPKLPVERAWVGPFGLDGDAHRADTVHGGPHRAVALFAIEAIRRVAADGHPIFPGSAGENLTTEGIEWASVKVGTRVEIGDRLVLEISKPDMPCDTIADSFIAGKSGRISILTHPLDSRMYARVLVDGEVRPGDRIVLAPPAPDSTAELHELLDQISAVSRGFNVSLWRAVAAAGFDVRVVDDGELAMVASPVLPGRSFNGVSGHRELPNLLPRMIDWFRTNGTVGWISADVAPWPGAVPERPGSIFAATPSAIRSAADRGGASELPDGLTVREIGPGDASAFAELAIEASSIDPGEAPARRGAIPRLIGLPGHHDILVEDRGRPIAVANVTVRRRVGMLGMMAVLPSLRGRGIQRALIAHRAVEAQVPGSHGRRQPSGASGWPTRSRGRSRHDEQIALYRCDPAELDRRAGTMRGERRTAARADRPGRVVARVTLSRPERHNAFDASLIAELRSAFGALGREEPASLRAVVLAGDGPSFCAGADIAWMRAALTLDTEANEQDAMAMADMFEAIDTCPVPVIAGSTARRSAAGWACAP